MQTGVGTDIRGPVTLEGHRVAVARAAEDAHTPAQPLLALGAELVYYPCLETMPPDNVDGLDREVKNIVAGNYDWLFLTTASAVIVIADRLAHLKLAPTDLVKSQIALFGSNTRLAAEDLLQVEIDKLPDAPSHAELAEALPLQRGNKVLLPIAGGGLDAWLAPLKTRGIDITTVAAYRTNIGHGGDKLPEMLWSGEVDAIAFTSENNVDYFAKRLHYEGGTLDMLDDVCVACIGPRTAEAASSRGLRVCVEPRLHTPEAMATELAAYFAGSGR